MENENKFNETPDSVSGNIENETAVADTSPNVKKILLRVKDIAVWVLFGLAILIMVFTIISSIFFNQKKGDSKTLFGLRFDIVLTDSMKEDKESGGRGAFASGDLIVGVKVDPSELKAGDIITFMSTNPTDTDQGKQTYGSIGATVSHKIREVVKSSDGKLIGFKTYGTTTGADDEVIVGPADIYSKYLFTVPFLGHFFQFIKTTPGYIVCILIPFLIIIALQIVNFVQIFRKYRSEQLSEMREEREKLEEDKQANARMMEELLALKAELERAKAQSAGSDAPPSEGEAKQ